MLFKCCLLAQVDAILWVTPKHTVEGLLKQLQRERRVPAALVPRPKAGRKKAGGGGPACELRRGHINVVDSDHLRELILGDLPSRAPRLARQPAPPARPASSNRFLRAGHLLGRALRASGALAAWALGPTAALCPGKCLR